jgi:hypothetical protein
MAYFQYYCLCKTAPSSPYNVVKVFITADNPFNARKLLEAQYGADRLLGPACLC